MLTATSSLAGLRPPDAMRLVIGRHAPEAVLPAIDQTRTVGLVTLPGRSSVCSVVLCQHLIATRRILPADLRDSLPAR